MTDSANIGAVVIGRNEGDRLVRCLASLDHGVSQIVYVDSGSSDDSVAAAKSAGADVLILDPNQPFTAARARNAGLDRLTSGANPPELVQFIDGDCELRSNWIDDASAFLETRPDVVVVGGRRRERFPEASAYNYLADTEWDTPVGEARSCGGDALMRIAALTKVGGYNPVMIAGEEPEMCVRLRQKGGIIWRLDAEMTWHDAAITRFGQWWRRSRRAGHAYAEGAALHGAPPERHNVAQTRRAMIWGAAIPLLALLGTLISPWSLLLFLVFPLQVARIARRGEDWQRAFFLTIGKFPEVQGVLDYHWGRLTRKRAGLIEYK